MTSTIFTLPSALDNLAPIPSNFPDILTSNFSLSSSRLAAGHPEGFFEAFANIYTEFADMINIQSKNKNLKPSYPTIDDGVKGIKFIFAAKKSSKLNSKWIKI